MNDETLVGLLLAQAAARGEAAALRSRRDGVWKAVSWRAWERRARALAARLVADLAGLMAGATVPIYPSSCPGTSRSTAASSRRPSR